MFFKKLFNKKPDEKKEEPKEKIPYYITVSTGQHLGAYTQISPGGVEELRLFADNLEHIGVKHIRWSNIDKNKICIYEPIRISYKLIEMKKGDVND